MNHDHDMMSSMGSLSCVRARYIQCLKITQFLKKRKCFSKATFLSSKRMNYLLCFSDTNQENMVDTTIYFVYLPSKNLDAVVWIMHIFKFDNRRELFFCTVRQESRGQRDRNSIFNLEGEINESE